ncbi:uncharacterized protein LOC108677081 [Hyalella azteca]|uniref:Uncharacterized protein LOC108677081 n=1 Tax=Hyalella azteca TaxID=294128 RepID=A0A8B7P6I7_HYAAZ|nr:uncharacterized protein LOC108677081 [Hyalella azteca]
MTLLLQCVRTLCLLGCSLLFLRARAEIIENSGCSVRREFLSVVCERLNSTALYRELQAKLKDPPTNKGFPSVPWVHELRVIDSRLPVLVSVTPSDTPALGAIKLLEVVRCQIRQVRLEAMMEVADSLRSLSLAHNKLVTIPSAVSVLEKLEVLDLRHNAITRLTPLLAQLPNLRHVKLDHNRIRQVTGWGSASHSPHLLSLTHLGLSNNLIHEVWNDALSVLRSLQSLDLSNNLLQRLSPSVDIPPHLMELDIRGNPWHCDCGAAWLSNLQLRTDPHALLSFLPTCGTPAYFRDQPLHALSTYELCSGIGNVNRTQLPPSDVDDHDIKISRIKSTTFDLTWNVTEISQRGQKIQEYMGWRVTFRKFSDAEESEVLLITLAGADAARKTGTSSGHYTVRHLTPATGYMVCIQTLTDHEINNIIESQRVVQTPRNSPESRGRSLKMDPSAFINTFHEEWRSVLEEEESITFAPTEVMESTTEEISVTTTDDEVTSTEGNGDSINQAQRFVYTSTGERIPINFGPPASPPALPAHPQRFLHPALASFEENSHPTNGAPFIRNVLPPPPPSSFGLRNSEQKFPIPFGRRKRAVGLPSVYKKGRCIEVTTEEEDEITMPVTVAATASSSTTMVILMICCCCFPKRCNRMRDSCIDRCKSIGSKTIVKTNSKTKTFVRPPKSEEKKFISKTLSASTPNLRLIEGDEALQEYQYHKLNKYYTMRGKEQGKTLIEIFPGYDLPKTAAAKYFGYDFPKIQNVREVKAVRYPNYVRRFSTDDNMSPVTSDRFIYYNMNKDQTNLNIPVDHCKYSDRIKGIKYSPAPRIPNDEERNKKPSSEFPIKASNNKIGFLTINPRKIEILLPRSKSETDLKSLDTLVKPKVRLYYNLLSEITPNEDKTNLQNNPGYDLPLRINKLGSSYFEKPLEMHEARLEIVRQFTQPAPKRPSLLNLDGVKNFNDCNQNGRAVHSNVGIGFTDDIYYSKPKPLKNGSTSLNNQNSYYKPHEEDYNSPSVPHPSRPRIIPVGEVAVTGGTLVEVPEGYVFPNKPRPINVLRLKVPADPASFSVA